MSADDDGYDKLIESLSGVPEAPPMMAFRSQEDRDAWWEKHEPEFMWDLCKKLGVSMKPSPERDAAITAWLQENEPSLMLRVSLRNAGFDVDGGVQS